MISVNYVNVPRVERKTELVFSPTSCTKLTVFQPGSIVILIEPYCSGHVSPIPGLTCLLIDRSNVVQASCSHTNLLCETLLYYSPAELPRQMEMRTAWNIFVLSGCIWPANSESGWCKIVSVEHFEIWVKKSQFLVKNLFFYIFNKVEAGFLFVIGWSWFYRSFCIKIKNIAYDRSVFNDKSVILRTFVIKVRCAIYLYFIVFANTFSTKCEFIIDISILAAGQNWAFCDFWWKSIILGFW